MTTPSLLALAPEIKLEILRHIKRPSDLKSVCLVNKEFSELAAQKLFRSTQLDVEAPLKDSARNALAGRSARYIKHLTLNRKGPVKDVLPSLEIIVDLLPKNVLFSIKLSRKFPIPFETFIRLCRIQTKLRSVAIQDFIGFSTTLLDSYVRDGIPGMKDLRALNVKATIDTWGETCAVAQKLIEAHSVSLKTLQIMPASHWTSAKGPSIYKPTAEVGPVFETLFKHAVVLPTYQALSLTCLVLDNIGLDASDQSILAFVDFTSLVQLRLRRCVDTAPFLTAMTERNHNVSSSLKVFEFAEYINETLDPLQNFLQSFKGLEQLYIVLRCTSSQLSVQSVTNHAASLTTLLIDCNEEDADVESNCYSDQEFKEICSACSLLEQLGTTFSADILDHEPSILSLSLLPRLVILNIKPGRSNVGISTQFTWECAAKRLAGLIFEKIHANVLGIGSCSENYTLVDADFDISVERLYYVRAEMKDALGRTSICAAETDLHDLQYAMPKFEMLQYRSPWFYRPSQQV